MSRGDRGRGQSSEKTYFTAPHRSRCRDFWEIRAKIAPHCWAPIGPYTMETTGDLLQQNAPELYE